MNYLAHAYLSNNNDGLLIGNFIADHLKGNNFSNLNNDIKNGIHLHRQIDSFTDNHPLFKKSKRLFYNGYEKYSGVLVDIYFDHLLARNFNTYANESLSDFSAKVYKVYQNNLIYLPVSSRKFLDYVTANNIYLAYAHLEGIETVLFHLSQRIKHKSALNNSVTLYKEMELEIAENFTAFFADLITEFYPKGIQTKTL